MGYHLSARSQPNRYAVQSVVANMNVSHWSAWQSDRTCTVVANNNIWLRYAANTRAATTCHTVPTEKIAECPDEIAQKIVTYGTNRNEDHSFSTQTIGPSHWDLLRITGTTCYYLNTYNQQCKWLPQCVRADNDLSITRKKQWCRVAVSNILCPW